MKLEAETLVAGRYRLLGRLGSGGMADVWCAEDAMLDRRVALKFLHERFAQDEQFVERFRREASAAAGLQHPNVVGVFDRGTFDGSHYIAMEYVEGAALNDLIERGISVGEAVEIVRQVLAGARYAHANGIVHRDLKPQNVLVDAEGRARVTDFGIARAGVSEITQTGSVLGTAQYLSPEQAQGLPVTAASDIYSVGVLLYEALTGRVPFEAESPVSVALKQVSERPQPPSQLNPAVSRALDAVVLKALAKDPANRFASAEEFLEALDAAEADPSGAALGDTAEHEAVAVAAGTPPASASRGPPGGPGLLHPGEADRPGAAPAPGRRGDRLRADAAGVRCSCPTVLGKDQAAAEAILEDAGLEVAVKVGGRTPKPEGTVLEQFPPAGDEVDEGSTVTITVSLGPDTVEVPDVAEQPAKQARRALEEAGFRVREDQRPSSTVRAGLAIGTEPPAGTELERGQPCDPADLERARSRSRCRLLSAFNRISPRARCDDEGLIPDIEQRDSDEPEGR